MKFIDEDVTHVNYSPVNDMILWKEAETDNQIAGKLIIICLNANES